jgi:hypothetical protein
MMNNCPACGAELNVILEVVEEENVYKVEAPEPYVQYRGPKDLPDETVYDATGQTFYQSATSNPDDYGPETYTGADATPRQTYPIRPAGSMNFTWRGGLIKGRHPIDYDIATMQQNAPEDQPYVNSAAMICDGTAAPKICTSMTVQRVRMMNVWDGIRFAPYEGNHVSVPGKYHHFVEDCHLSGVLDDAIEDDHGQSITIRRSLFEDIFVLISARVTNGEDHSVDVIGIADSLIKVAPRVDTINNIPGTFLICPYKSNPVAPRMVMRNTILAIQGEIATWSGKLEQWNIMWSKLTDLGGNTLLYLDDGPMPGPELIGDVPAGFEQLVGEAARALWDNERLGWIEAHPEVM